MIKVILCDDHALIRRGIRDTLSDASDIQSVERQACRLSSFVVTGDAILIEERAVCRRRGAKCSRRCPLGRSSLCVTGGRSENHHPGDQKPD